MQLNNTIISADPIKFTKSSLNIYIHIFYFLIKAAVTYLK